MKRRIVSSGTKVESSHERDAKRILLAVLVAGVAMIMGMMHRFATQGQYRSITRTIEQWKPIYGLDEVQARTIREIELDFHGSGSPFSFRGKRTPEQVLEHYKEISKVMSPESGARFLADMESERQ